METRTLQDIFSFCLECLEISVSRPRSSSISVTKLAISFIRYFKSYYQIQSKSQFTDFSTDVLALMHYALKIVEDINSGELNFIGSFKVCEFINSFVSILTNK